MSSEPIKVPEMLDIAVERMFLDIASEMMDPLIAMKLTQVVKGVSHLSYTMGVQDSARGKQVDNCPECPYHHRGI